MAFGGVCCNVAFNDLRKHYECRGARFHLPRDTHQTSVNGVLIGRRTNHEALAEQSNCQTAALDHTAKQMQHRIQPDANTTASPHNYSKAMPSTRQSTLQMTGLADNGKQHDKMSYDSALDASSDSGDFPDDGTPRSAHATKRQHCLGGTRASLVRKAADLATMLKTPRHRRRKPTEGNDHCNCAQSVVYDNANGPNVNHADMDDVSCRANGRADCKDVVQDLRPRDDERTSVLTS